MSGKLATVLIVVVAVLGFVVGFYFRRAPAPPNEPKTEQRPPKQVKVKIIMDPNKACKQVNSGSGQADKVPQLYKAPGDTIVWEKGIAPGGLSPLTIEFPLTSNGHNGTPFIGADGKSLYILHDGDTGTIDPNAACDTYLFKSAQVGPDYCTNPQDPGVIIDK